MRRRPVLVASGLLAVGALVAANAPAQARTGVNLAATAAAAERGGFPGAGTPLGDADRTGRPLAPLSAATAAVRGLGGDVHAQYGKYGTVSSLVRDGGFLATGLAGSPEQVARAFLRTHSGLLGLTPAEVDGLALVDDAPLAASTARAVAFQQSVDGVPLANSGRVVVGVLGDKVGSVSAGTVSSATLRSLQRPSSPISAVQAVVAAGKDAGIKGLSTTTVSITQADAQWTTLQVKGIKQKQMARQRALPTTDHGVRLVWETAVQDVAGGTTIAAHSFVDAANGTVLLRQDAVDNLAEGVGPATAVQPAALHTQTVPSGGALQGTYSATGCGPAVPFTVPAGTKSLVVAVTGANPADDIALNVVRNTQSIGSADVATSPEVVTATIQDAGGSLATDTFTAQVCPSTAPIAPLTGPFTFVGSYGTTDQTAVLPRLPYGLLPGSDLLGPDTYRAFQSSPQIAPTASSDTDRSTICDADYGASKAGVTCDAFTNRPTVDGTQYGSSTPPSTPTKQFPYDVNPLTGTPSFLTFGNNALTTNAQGSTSLTPGPPAVPYSDPTRNYAPAFTDAWRASGCDPTQTLGGADVNAAIVNLFTGHNRVHDFAYRLGLTENRGALQVVNYGVPTDNADVREGDPELGNAQNAAATTAVLDQSGVLTGRNNANQVTEMDGVPGITNQYLFEPVLGFYGPCADGDLDASVFLHEYTHAISNRLVGGPGQTLSGQQGGSMGESWSDLDALEYLHAFGLTGLHGEDPDSIGAYATGNKTIGIRDYNLRLNPLNYAEFGFDSTGPEVHADGEIWNGVQWTVRQALVNAYDAVAPHTDAALEKACALGVSANGAAHSTFAGCPGDRRWIQYLYDGMILQGTGTPSMVDIKNNMLDAALLRGSTADRATMADAFATRGLGATSSSPAVGDTAGYDNTDPVPSFASPDGSRNATVTFDLVDAATGAKVPGQVFLGHYSARAVPVATTLPGKQPPTATIVAGQYDFVVQAAGYGLQRFSVPLAPGGTTHQFALERNVASKSSGAKVSGDGGVALDSVVDDDEGTDGGFDGTADSKPVAGRTITVDLGGYKKIDRIAVSALHHPAPASGTGLPIIGADDPTFQGRLLGVRAFDLQASTDGGKTFSTVYSSPDDFFPASRPRPVAPEINLRTVQLPQAVTADHLRMVIRSNQCTGGPDFNGQQKSAAAVALNGDSACAYTNGVPAAGATAAKGASAAAPDTANAQASQVTVTELEAFGTPTTAPVDQQPPAKDPVTRTGNGNGTSTVGTAPVRGRALAATGGSVALGAIALLLMGGAALGLRAARRREV